MRSASNVASASASAWSGSLSPVSPAASTPSPADRGLASVGQLDLPVHHPQPGALVDLMLLEPLAPGQEDEDRPALALGMQDLGLMGLDVHAPQVPTLHAAPLASDAGGDPIAGLRIEDSPKLEWGTARIVGRGGVVQ